MSNAGFAAVFRELANFLEFEGENPFKVRAYRRAADILESLNQDAAKLAREGQLKSIKGIGVAIEEKTLEIADSGTLKVLEDVKSKYPPGVMDLQKVPGIGPRTASLIFHELGVAGIDQLEEAARKGELRTLPGMGQKSEENILRAVTRLKDIDMARIPLVIADRISKSLIGFLASHMRINNISVAGSVRRRKETCGDLDIVVGTEDSSRILNLIRSWNGFRTMISCDEDRITFTADGDVEVDISIVEPAEFPFALLATTGSKNHLAGLKSVAHRLGLKLARDGLFSEKGENPEVACEADIYKALGMEYVPPELREMTGEIEAALEKRLPRLLVAEDIRGDLHMHTSWSDGAESIESMAEAAKALGYEYVAITDHSKSLGIAGGLSEMRLAKQMEALNLLRAKFAGIHLLSGIELEILKDGSLDYPDSVLYDLDVVVASVHSAFGQPEDVMTDRIVKAIRSGSVNIIAHPTGRVLGRRLGYDVDMDTVIYEAARHNVALEINAYPERMDLDSKLARKAMEAGVYIVINTDSHNTNELRFMSYGLDVARRAWLEPDYVINTWPLAKLQAWLKQSRRGP
ncbi:MAG: DNA polymerase/3'-5' exonuclease PolX [Firmicutes bacterium]|nr:DNA polymerase/3'-5' exonuclease PolX [Bacillota bacterium]